MSILTLVILSLPPGLRPWPPPDAQTAAILREALDGNRAGIAAVRTLTCRIDESWLGQVPNDPNGPVPDLNAWDFWMDGDTIRVRDRVVPGWYTPRDQVQRGDREMELVRDGLPHVGLRRKRRLAHGDARRVCLFSRWELNAPYREDLSLAGLLAQSHEVWAARRVGEDGVPSLYLDLAFPANRLRLWLDPAQNYLVWKADEDSALKYHVTEFRRSADGAAIPTRVELRITLPMAQPATLVTTLSDVHLNEPVPAESFRIPGLAGLRCHDSFRDEYYRLDANGESAGPWTTDPEPDDESEKPNARRIATYILCGLAAIGLLIAVASYWRGKRA